jgi:hypothetical protein
MNKYWLVLGATAVSLAAAGPTEVTVHEDKPFPESITSTSDGSLIMGSVTKGEVFRAAKGAATAEPWIKPGTNGLQRILGVFADEKAGTLWVCSSKAAQGPPTALKAFDLKTGAPKGSYDFLAITRFATTSQSDPTARPMPLIRLPPAYCD